MCGVCSFRLHAFGCAVQEIGKMHTVLAALCICIREGGTYR